MGFHRMEQDHLAEPEVLRRAGGLLRLARGRPHRGLAADHGAHLHAGGRHRLCVLPPLGVFDPLGLIETRDTRSTPPVAWAAPRPPPSSKRIPWGELILSTSPLPLIDRSCPVCAGASVA